MQTEPPYFIEAVCHNGIVKNISLAPIKLLQWALSASEKYGITTIAIFKIYPKPKPVVVTYDYDLKTMITE